MLHGTAMRKLVQGETTFKEMVTSASSAEEACFCQLHMQKQIQTHYWMLYTGNLLTVNNTNIWTSSIHGSTSLGFGHFLVEVSRNVFAAVHVWRYL